MRFNQYYFLQIFFRKILLASLIVLGNFAANANGEEKYYVAPLRSSYININEQAGLCADAAGNLIWASGNWIYRLAPSYSSNPQTFYQPPSGFPSINRIVATPSGTVFISCQDHTVRRITTGGVMTILAGNPNQSGHRDGTVALSLLNSPQGLAVDSQGNVWVADHANQVIRRIGSNGEVTTVAGRPGIAGTADGVGDTARFGSEGVMNALTLSASGDLYLAERSRIRRITPTGEVITLAATFFQYCGFSLRCSRKVAYF